MKQICFPRISLFFRPKSCEFGEIGRRNTCCRLLAHLFHHASPFFFVMIFESFNGISASEEEDKVILKRLCSGALFLKR